MLSALTVRSLQRIALCTIASFMAMSPMLAQQPPFQHEQVLDGLAVPTSATFLPNGRMLITSLYGTVWITSPVNQPPVTYSVYLQLQNLNNSAEHGLMEVLLDPDFATNNFIYLYYSTTANKNRVSRFLHQGTTASLASETVIFETPDTFSNCCHVGGAMAFANDGHILLAVGDDFTPALAQDLTKSYGKVHRFKKTGGAPTDNPYWDATPGLYNSTGKLKTIYASGLRNPFRGSYDTVTGRFLIGEVGGNDHTVAWEDLHLNAPAANFGWPVCGDGGRNASGMCLDPQYSDPVFTYPHALTGASITAGFTYRGSMFPPAWVGRYFYGDYVRGWIRYLEFDANGNVTNDQPFVDPNVFGGVTALSLVKIFQGPDGSLFYISLVDNGLNYTGGIHRIFYSTNLAPVCGTVTASPADGPGPTLSTTLSASATDPEGASLTYTWSFGDGSPSATGASVPHTYTSSGTFTAQVVVSDGTNTISCGTVPVTVGQAPTAQILSPSSGSTFRAGDAITFVGAGTDDDALTQASYSWNVVFNHDQHIHPETGSTGSSSFDLVIPTTGHGFSGVTYYTITLTVTDQDGLTATSSVQIFPEKVSVTVNSSPPGLEVLVEGLPVETPYTLDQAIGYQMQLGVVSSQQCQNNNTYLFGSWSDGLPMIHPYTVPTTASTVTAQFTNSGACQSCGQSLSFDGTDDFVEFTPFTIAGDWTIEFWLRPLPGFTSGDAILGNDTDLSLDLQGGKLRLFKGSTKLTSSANVIPNQWTHYAITRTGSALLLYVNGVLDATAASSALTGSTSIRWMGKGVNPGFLGAALDEVRIWSAARSQTEIFQNLGVHVSPASGGVVAYWRFDQPATAQLVDDLGPSDRDGVRGAGLMPGTDDPLFSATSGPMQYACDRTIGLQLKVFLQGPYDGASGMMNDRLRAQNRLPLQEPYTGIGFALGASAGATTTNAVLSVTGPNAIVDWVLVEVRDMYTPSVILRRVPALLQRDGDVVGTDGTSTLLITVDRPNAYIALRHRNHFGVMTAQALPMQSSTVVLDFTTASTLTYGTSARTSFLGVLLCWAGNTNLDASLKYVGVDNDRDPILVAIGGSVPTNVISGYLLTDLDLDGTVKYTGAGNDRDLILTNIGGLNVNFVRNEQLP